MDLGLSEDQRALHDAITSIVSAHLEVPRTGGTLKPVEFFYADELDAALEAGGFFDLALSEDYGALEAALLVYEVGRSPLVMEAMASALIAPILTGGSLARPIAVARVQDLCRGVRFLDRAKTLIVDLGDDVVILDAANLRIVPVPSMFAYPLGKFASPPDLSAGRRLGRQAADDLRRLWRVGVAIEIASALQAAIDFTTDYVKERRVFNRPVGSFQAVQHRLAADLQKSRGAYWLAMRAAWSGLEADAATAALYAQQSIAAVTYDTHQFNGALGMTLEHSLHFWTFRLRLLQAELGAARSQGAAVADLVWPARDAA